MKKLLLTLPLVVGACTSAPDAPLPTVASVDVERYQGRWYEIARLENSFERGCEANEANYRLLDTGDIEVTNKCYRGSPDGKLKKATGRAWLADKEDTSRLKVSFFLSKYKVGLFSGDYHVLELADDYSYVMVGEPGRKYFWILARDQKMEAGTYAALLSKAERLGFDLKSLVKVQHKSGA